MALEVNAMQKGLVAVDVGGERFHTQQVCVRSCSALVPPVCVQFAGSSQPGHHHRQWPGCNGLRVHHIVTIIPKRHC